MKQSYVYILTNKNNTVLYNGVTSNLTKRMYQHKLKSFKGFATKYNCEKLVYFETLDSIEMAIDREKQIKNYKRYKKIDLIEKENPKWKDLSDGWLFYFD
ncbi:GIY-YIG nuclease family protein [Seonamhaeicola maritimus]|uniref:GIY-YIG nuclease family protein n=1 Tax=Seonamhaeicola maritimus TaxID=2591822 RepID=UPI00249444A2|nr:GIY-YIG nuclease family protein [Seonamhaeicola maritimus]